MTLTTTEISRLAAELDRRYGSLIEEVREELENSENQQYVELIGRGPADAGDEAAGDALADLELAVIDRHVQEIRDIEAAKARIRAGRFGICVDCGAEIDFDRLRAYPTAKRCFACQRQREKTYVHEGTPTL